MFQGLNIGKWSTETNCDGVAVVKNMKTVMCQKGGTLPLTLAGYGVSPPSVGQGGGGCNPPPLGISKRSVVELSGKDQRIALAEYSRLVVLFRSIFDPVMAGQRSNFRKFYDFSTLRVYISKTIYRSGMGPSPACSPFNSAQSVMCFDASRLSI